jgi:putative transposase
MKIHRGFKYRLLPTEEQAGKLAQWGGCTRWVWNYFLALNKEHYKKTGKFIFKYDMSKMLTQLKKKPEAEFLSKMSANCLTVAVHHLDDALRGCFKKSAKKKGFPKFKAKDKCSDSFTVPQARRFKVRDGSVYIEKFGWIKWKKHRALQGKPRQITVTQDGDQWYASVMCEMKVAEKKPQKQGNIIGIDVGTRKLMVFSDGTIIPNPKHYLDAEKKLVMEQRRLSRKEKGSANRKKQRVKVAKVHRKVRNIRKDFLQNLTTELVRKYDGFVVEDLNVKGMMRSGRKGVVRGIADAGWGMFNTMLEYKCKEHGKVYEKIGRFFPSSKTCSGCGNIQEIGKAEAYKCPKCGLVIDRDLNAAKNIIAVWSGELTPVEMGRFMSKSGRCPSMKQEKECGDDSTMPPKKSEKTVWIHSPRRVCQEDLFDEIQ